MWGKISPSNKEHKVTIFIKILIYFAILAGAVFSNLPEKIGISDSILALLLFLTYLFLLYLEIKLRIVKNDEFERIQKSSFILSFWIGGIWGIIGTFAAGFHYKINPIILLINFAITGILFGFIGRYISRVFQKYLLKKNSMND
jgi:hypothetical protein